MNARATWLFGTLTCANVWVAVSLVVACRVSTFTWSQMLPGQDLPAITAVAIPIAPYVGVGMILTSLAGLVWAISDRAASQRLRVLFSVTALIEIICLSSYLWALILPLWNITYTLGEPATG